ncbi:MAG: hypothetical protein MCS20_01470 [Candidatus Phytoplasma mali]|nr:hypothetical protein [Candidatus Phytoplasma australiense]MCG7202064.1 hypothetical protein [Candidatus Phytoplasma mali]
MKKNQKNICKVRATILSTKKTLYIYIYIYIKIGKTILMNSRIIINLFQ